MSKNPIVTMYPDLVIAAGSLVWTFMASTDEFTLAALVTGLGAPSDLAKARFGSSGQQLSVQSCVLICLLRIAPNHCFLLVDDHARFCTLGFEHLCGLSVNYWGLGTLSGTAIASC